MEVGSLLGSCGNAGERGQSPDSGGAQGWLHLDLFHTQGLLGVLMVAQEMRERR